ncbi:MAG TPA: hypothetical protein VFX28_23840 [Methylomirabilota bacterium]|nr:hypothetical protein [Methylomirabilota bacterium]
MRRMLAVGAGGALLLGALAGGAFGGDVNIGINIGVPPPPPPVIVARPAIVKVPGSPVLYAPHAELNLFVFGGRYYSFHDGAWFQATSHAGPWTVIVTDRVPQPVLAVPVQYYKIPPGHAKKLQGGHPGRGEPGPPGHAKGGKRKHD